MESYDYGKDARLVLRGPDRVRFLHGMVTCDVEKLAAGAGSRAAMLSVKGRLLATLGVHARAESLLLTMDGELGDKVRGLLDKHIVMDDVEVLDESQALSELGLYGDDAPAALGRALDVEAARLLALAPHQHLELAHGRDEVLVLRDPSLGGIGFRLIGARARIASLAGELGATPMHEGTHELRRIEAGTARYGVDLDEERLVVEANLEDAISFDKGCYLGQEVVVRATSRGRVNRRLMGLVVSGEGPLPHKAKLGSAAHADAGLVTSSVVSERMGGPIALAYVHRSAAEAGGAVTVLDGDRPAIAVELPFTVERAAEARAKLERLTSPAAAPG